MKFIHVKNLEKYHPSYKDRKLVWCKTYFSMINADPEFEMLDEIDKWRFVCLVMLEIQLQNPVPLEDKYLIRKGFDLKKRSIALSLRMLHNLIDIVTDSGQDSLRKCDLDKEKEEEKDKEKEIEKDLRYAEFVYMKEKEYCQLGEKLGEEVRNQKIEDLNLWKGSKGKKTASDYLTILNWVRKGESQISNFKTYDELRRDKLKKITEEVCNEPK